MDSATSDSHAATQTSGEIDLKLERVAYWLTLAAALAPIVSTAAMNILLGAAMAVTLLAYKRLEMPRGLLLPLILFFGGTLLALLLSADPGAGLPQIKKFYIFLSFPLVFTILRRQAGVERLLIGWAVLATASGLWSFVQFLIKRQEALDYGQSVYMHYLGQRATGFMSHWMTFAGEQMIVILMLSAALLFGVVQKHRSLLWAATAVIGISIAVSFVRAAWLGTAIGAVYLIAMWRARVLLLLPFIAALGWFVSPPSVQQRVVSIYKPHGTADSNQHRHITRRMGMEIIRSSPWVGIGPEMVKRDYEKYIPKDVPRPLPEGYYLHLHNLYLQYGAERGIPTLLALLWFIGALLVQLWRSATRLGSADRLSRACIHGSIAIVLAVLAEGLFEVNLGDSEVLMMFLTAIGCTYALKEHRTADA